MRRASLALVCLFLVGCAAARGERVAAVWDDVVQIRAGASLRAVSAPSGDVVWCSGTGGLVLRSVDGGSSFGAVGPAGARGLDFRSLVAFDRDRAIVANAGAPARVYRTVDGGASWSVVHEDRREGAFFDALAFADDRRGYLLGDPIGGIVQFFATEDGGATWTEGKGLPTAVDGEAMFAASCSCMLARGDVVEFVTGGRESRVFRSRDRGASWTLAMLPLRHGKASQGAFAIAPVGDGERVVVGGDYAEPESADGCGAHTSEGGAVFLASRGLGGYHSGVAVVGARTVVAVGPRGSSLSNDGGASYVPFGDTGFHAVTCVGERVFAVGADGRFGRARLTPK